MVQNRHQAAEVAVAAAVVLGFEGRTVRRSRLRCGGNWRWFWFPLSLNFFFFFEQEVDVQYNTESVAFQGGIVCPGQLSQVSNNGCSGTEYSMQRGVKKTKNFGPILDLHLGSYAGDVVLGVKLGAVRDVAAPTTQNPTRF